MSLDLIKYLIGLTSPFILIAMAIMIFFLIKNKNEKGKKQTDEYLNN